MLHFERLLALYIGLNYAMAANLFELNCVFFSFSLKIGGWHVILFIRHMGVMLGFKRGLIITTL